MKNIETKFCVECKHFKMHEYENECLKGHRLRFYTPRSMFDDKCGYKRKYDDFEEIDR